MKAIIARKYGGPEVLHFENIERPKPRANEVLIKIKATSVTAASTFMREGKPYFGRLFIGLTSPKVKTPGTDLSGEIVAIGNSVKGFKPGDNVMAETSLSCGAYAEFICLSEDELIVHKPDNITHEEATGILDGACTALAFFSDHVQIEDGHKILINGASGSIGTAAVQLAKFFGGEVTGVCSGKNKALVKDLGADYVLDYTKNEFLEDSEKYDVIFDTVGKLSFSECKMRLTQNGIFITPVLSFSAILNMIFVSPFSKRKLKFDATGMRKMERRKDDLIQIRDMVAARKLVTVVDRVYPFSQIHEAHKYVDSGRKRGNVVLSMKV